MDQAHRKVELQTPSDLQFLISNASSTARQKIDLHFPQSAAQQPANGQAETDTSISSLASADVTRDPMRRRVEEIVQSFIEQTFSGVKQNISVNGLEGAEMEALLKDAVDERQETEPFDHRLARKVQDVSSQIESLQLQLADLRRTAPAETASRYVAALDAEEESRRAGAVRATQEEVERAGEVQLDVKGLGNAADMQRSWQEGTKNLIQIREGIGGVVGRLERAREGVVYLESA